MGKDAVKRTDLEPLSSNANIMSNFQKNIRNFCIIAHIDHGKSTLADRFLELTGTIEQRKMREQFLDMMDLEREKGITIKLQPVRMEFQIPNSKFYILNLIDTPGHVDFSYEVSRSLAAVEGAILLVDASQGIQAQTLANLHLAKEQGLAIIPVINKIDLVNARVEETEKEIKNILGEGIEILKISAKNGTNVKSVLEAIFEKVPPASGDSEAPLRALIFDSQYDPYKGVVAYVRIADGFVKKGQKILMLASRVESEVLETGVFKPELKPAETLRAGEIGYLATGLKEIEKCRVGDTITADGAGQRANGIKPLVGYQEPKSMVFAGFYPIDGDDFDLLKNGLDKLKLNDASLSFQLESSEALGRGFQGGFLGLLHLEIVSQRLKREYGLNLIITAPSVAYVGGSTSHMEEPWVKLEIISPSRYLGPVMKLVSGLSGIQYKDTQYLGPEKVLLVYEAPLREIIMDFYDRLKSATAGYASMSYELVGYRRADLVKLDILVAGEKVEPFSRIVPKARACQEGRVLVEKLKEVIPPHQFSIPLQAAVGGKIIARENIKPLRKDVIAGLYGGDYTRKKKLLEKQKRGKKKMKRVGGVDIPQEAFLDVLKR